MYDKNAQDYDAEAERIRTMPQGVSRERAIASQTLALYHLPENLLADGVRYDAVAEHIRTMPQGDSRGRAISSQTLALIKLPENLLADGVRYDAVAERIRTMPHEGDSREHAIANQALALTKLPENLLGDGVRYDAAAERIRTMPQGVSRERAIASQASVLKIIETVRRRREADVQRARQARVAHERATQELSAETFAAQARDAEARKAEEVSRQARTTHERATQELSAETLAAQARATEARKATEFSRQARVEQECATQEFSEQERSAKAFIEAQERAAQETIPVLQIKLQTMNSTPQELLEVQALLKMHALRHPKELRFADQVTDNSPTIRENAIRRREQQEVVRSLQSRGVNPRILDNVSPMQLGEAFQTLYATQQHKESEIYVGADTLGYREELERGKEFQKTLVKLQNELQPDTIDYNALRQKQLQEILVEIRSTPQELLGALALSKIDSSRHPRALRFSDQILDANPTRKRDVMRRMRQAEIARELQDYGAFPNILTSAPRLELENAFYN